MRRRILTTALAATLAVVGLAGCRTNVGVAARIDGQRVSESAVNNYITPNAKPVSSQDANNKQVTISPRSFVVSQLINARLLVLVFRQLPGGSKALSRADAELTRELSGKSYIRQAEQIGLKGYSSRFDQLYLRNRLLLTALQNVAQGGADVQGAVQKIRIKVWVAPRYGTWDAKTLSFDNAPALPSFLKLQPSSGA